MNTIAKLSYIAPQMELSADFKAVCLWAALGLAATALMAHVFGADLGSAMALIG